MILDFGLKNKVIMNLFIILFFNHYLNRSMQLIVYLPENIDF